MARLLTRWDTRQLVRAALATAAALVLAWLVTAATDEGGIGWGERAGRTLPLTPLCAAVGAWVALAPVRARGEALALEAMGRSPAQIAAAAAAGATLVALMAALVIAAVHRIDVAGFFPTAARASAWRWTGDAFVDTALGLRICADGTPLRIAAGADVSVAGIPQHGRGAAAAVTALSGLALPLLVSRSFLSRGRVLAVALASGAAIVATVVAFQAAAAQRAPVWLGVAPALALLAFAIRRYRA